MTKRSTKLRDELTIILINLEQIEWAINRARGDLEHAQKGLNYIMQKLQKLKNRYNKTKHVTPVTKEAEEK